MSQDVKWCPSSDGHFQLTHDVTWITEEELSNHVAMVNIHEADENDPYPATRHFNVNEAHVQELFGSIKKERGSRAIVDEIGDGGLQ